MNTGLLKKFIIMALMVASALGAPMLRATTSLADQRPPIDLENMVPRQFGEWREQTGLAMQLVDPELQASVDRLYSSTLSRTYINRDGYRIMVSIAYGKDQSDALQVHKPEICYPAQGFQLEAKERIALDMPERSLPATRLRTHMGQRFEPITYWIVLGDQVTRGGVDKKLKEMRYSLLQRTMPDGMLVRLSSIDRDTAKAYQTQADFASAMVGAIAPENRSRFAGATLKP
ncbi:MAG: EpsI family protein [Comamonadaceae bacterium]|nr:EpsI family protein [Comamonadaceae bacterium]